MTGEGIRNNDYLLVDRSRERSISRSSVKGMAFGGRIRAEFADG